MRNNKHKKKVVESINYKKVIYGLLIGTIFLMILCTGGTYAYYSFGISDNVVGSSVEEDINIDYKQGSFINNSFIPINDQYSSVLANKYDFEIIVDKKYVNYEIGLSVNLINIEMDEVFYNWLDYLKYELVDQNNNVLINGDFKNIKDKTLNLNNNMIILDTDYLNESNACYNDVNCSYRYQLRIWLSDICIDSNNIETCPNYLEQLNKYNEENCVNNNGIFDCSLATKSFVYENRQNELQNKKISMNLHVDTGLRK